MTNAQMPEWVALARKFIATGQEEFLTRAAAACSDPSVRQLLQRPEAKEGTLPPDDWRPLAERLNTEGKITEAAVVVLVGLRSIALAADSPERLDQQARQITEGVCNRAASLSREHDFPECVARFARTLGTRAADLHKWQKAQSLLLHAAGLYNTLAQTEPHVYRPYVAGTLNNLGNVLREQRDFPAARRAFEEAVDIYRELAQTDPHTYRPDVAMTLNNLGNVLSEQRDFPAARRAFEEAVDICRELAEAHLHIYRPDVAMTLNNLGNVLRDQRDFPAARRAFEEAVNIYRELAQTGPHIYRPYVATTLNNLGNVLRDQRDSPAARRAFEEAVDIYRDLAQTEPHIYRPYVAITLNNLGTVLSDQRDFPAARRAFEEALEIRRDLAQTEPHIYRPDVAMALNNLGAVLREQQDFPAARQAFEEALEIRRELAKIEPHIYRHYVAMTLNNLGIVLREQPDFPAARRAFEESLEIRRELAQTEPHIYRPYVAGTLNNLGTVLSEQRDFPAARRAFEKTVDTYRELAQTEPHIYRPEVATTLNNLGNVLERSGDVQLALDASRQAVQAAEESSEDSKLIWLAKGKASAAYKRWLTHLVSRNEYDPAFRCLAAMREGPVRALSEAPTKGLEAAAEALAAVGDKLGRPVRILVAQSLKGPGTVLAVLDADHPEHLDCHLADGFLDAAETLFKEIITVFDEDDKRNGKIRREALSSLATKLWQLLPEPVRKLLDPAADHDVLISGDPFGTAFPWEALRCGDGEHDWLGLQRTLPRWGALTAASIRELAPRVFGDGAPTAAIVCPWNAIPEKHLLFSKAEAENLRPALRDMGYTLVPDGSPLMGPAAQPTAMSRVLENSTSVIHYTGHGAIIGNEELLVLHSGDAKHPSAYFGRQELQTLKDQQGRTSLLQHRPLLVLNSCMTGRSRNFGGQREDLAWTFLTEGAEAVIASALPVYDRIGQVFGESLYDSCFASPKGMGWTLVEVRKSLEKNTRDLNSKLWPAWTLLTYHGNPYARLPHLGDGG